MFAVYSRAVATFLIGLGRQPVDVDFRAAIPVYIFADAAHADLVHYRAANERLDTMVKRKRAVSVPPGATPHEGGSGVST
jgi:hypothetical protein